MEGYSKFYLDWRSTINAVWRIIAFAHVSKELLTLLIAFGAWLCRREFLKQHNKIS